MNAPTPPFPTNPTTGQYFGSWCWNGQTWVPAPMQGIRLITTVFTANGTYIPSPGLVSLVVECIGGGGGGAGTVADAADGVAGGGGGSGGYSRKTLDASLVLGGVIVTIGGGGAGGLATTTASPPVWLGGVGGTTSFGALCLAYGGNGGGYGTASGAGGAGANPGIGDIAFVGSAGLSGLQGTVGSVLWIHAGAGGHIFGGNTAPQEVANTSASSASIIAGGGGEPLSGAGGTGGAASRSATGATGGPGGTGVCIVTEYCWVGSGGPPDGCAPIPITGCGPGWGDPC